MTSAVTPPKTHYNRRQQTQTRRAVRFQTAAVVPPIASPTQQSAPKTQAAAAPSPKPTLVTLAGVNKTYDNGSQALKNLNLTVKKGDFLFVTGPSGAGKSTLLKLLYGQERATSGDIIVDEQNLAKLKGNRLAMLRRRIGIVFQDYKLIPRRTVAENVSFVRSEEHTSELHSHSDLVCRLLLEKKKKNTHKALHIAINIIYNSRTPYRCQTSPY